MSADSLYSLNEVVFKFAAKGKTRNFLKRLFHGNGKTDDENLISAEAFTLGPISLNIARGKLTSILGRSGSGKTTLLSLLGLLRRPVEGELTIRLDENYPIADLWQDERQIEHFRAQHLGFALQRGELLPYLTLRENAEVVLRFLGKDEAQIRDSVQEIFQRLFDGERREGKFEEVVDSKPLNVSQGQYQRGSIVRALANTPSIVLADEPTGNLDHHTGEMAMQIFRQLVDATQAAANPQTVVVVTHDLPLSMKFAHEIIVLSNGVKRAHYALEPREGSRVWKNTANAETQFSEDEFEKRLLSDLKN